VYTNDIHIAAVLFVDQW